AGACTGKSHCTFRDIPMAADTKFQVVDLGLVKHDMHDEIDARADKTCAVADGDLVCNRPAASVAYRVWIVPEAVAVKAGASALDLALSDELPEDDMADANDK
ncbi:MAG: hypothetical protein ACRCS9_09160, partial [Hyphomicrobium sp.]